MGKRHEVEHLFGEAIGKIGSTETNGYLGDPDIVDAMIRDIASEAIQKLGSGADASKVIKTLCGPVAKVFLGKDKNFAPVRGWNKPGVIDSFVARWCGVKDARGPEMRIVGGLARMILEVMDVIKYANTPGVLDEQWKPQIDEIIQRYTGIFMGICPPTMAML